MKNFTILLAALAIATLASCSKMEEEDWYGDYLDTDSQSDTQAQTDTEPADQTDTADTDANDTDINDTDVNDTDVNDTDINDTDVNDSDNPDSTDDNTIPTTDDDPVNPTDGDPVNPTDDDPVNPTDDDPVNPTDDDPVNPTDDDPVNPTDDDSVNPTDDDPVNPTDDDSVNPTDDDPVNPTDDDTETSDEDTVDPDDIVPDCVPNCEGKLCGHDGCGGICVTDCGTDAACNADQTACVPYECDKITVTNFQDWGSYYHGKCQYQGENYDLKLLINNPENLSDPVDLSQFQKFSRCSKDKTVCLYFFYGSDKLFFQQSGTIDINQSGTFPLTDVRLVETGYVLSTTVTYEIPGGKCIEIENQSLDYFVY